MKVWESVLRWTMVYGLWTAAAAAYTPPEGSPLARRAHPRLFFTEEALPGIRERIRTQYPDEFRELVSVMDAVYATAPGSKSDALRYFDTRNYAFLCAVDPAELGVAAGHTRAQYCTRAVEHVAAISSGCQDARHDFASWWKTGGCKMAAGLAYDWTYPHVTPAQRQAMADKLLALHENEKGSDVFPPYNSDRHNISNQILPYMHGTIFGALALWGDATVPVAKGQEMLDHMHEGFLVRVMAVSDALYGPDAPGRYPELWGSGNPEGPAYGFSIFGAYMYPIAAASTALGEDYVAASPFTRDIPLYYYYKLHPFVVDGAYHFSWHDTGTPHDAQFAAGCASDCETTRPRLFRLWAQALARSDRQLAGVVSWMVGTSPFGIPLTGYKYAEGVRQYGLFGMFLGGERDVPPLTPDEAGLPLFKRMGDWTVFKSSHDLESSTYLEIDAPVWRYVGGHNKYVPTGLQMSKYGTLLVKTVNAKNSGICPRLADSGGVSSGSVTGPRADAFLSLGLPSAKTHDQADPAQIVEGSASDIGDVTVFDSESGIYDVFGYDYTKSYRSGIVADRAVQQMAYLRGGEDREFFVEFNHVRSDYETRKILHTSADIEAVDGAWSSAGSGTWTSAARVFKVTNTYGGSHGRLFITSAYPVQAERLKIGGSGFEWIDADGNSLYGGGLAPSCRNVAGFYTLQVRTGEPDLVTVYQPGNSLSLQAPEPVTRVEAEGWRGVQVGDRVVLFATPPEIPRMAAGYTVQTARPAHHILIGFEPSRAYAVSVNAVPHQAMSSRGGVVSFVDEGTGTRAVVIGGGLGPLPGDLTGDGQVTLADLRLLVSMLPGQAAPSAEAKALAAPTDQVTPADVREMMRILVQA